jgi:pimeloyl-ACP methyl ester carboxylesterase
MNELLCFHGSPGLPEDFDAVASRLAPLPVVGLPREGYPGAKAIPGKKQARRFVVGYSWGAKVALEWASTHSEEVSGLILISPFLSPSKPTGLAKRLLVSLPVLGDTILKKAAPGAIETFLVDSSSPSAVPDFYRAQKASLCRPEILRASLLEKGGAPLDFTALQATLSPLPVLLVWGAQDKTAAESEHVAPLRKLFARLKEKKVEGGGHALVYTHADSVADEIKAFLSERDQS